MFHCNYTSLIHHFRYIQVFLLAGNDVIALSPLGSAVGDLSLRILKERPRFFVVVFHCNFTSIIHQFRYIQVFLLAGNDVIALSSLGGAVGDASLRNLSGQSRLPFHVTLTFFVFLELFSSYSTLFIWLGFQHLGLFWGSFRGSHPIIVF